jgi:hypothetical protein
MPARICPHCDAELTFSTAMDCPGCGLDPDLPTLAFEDAPAFFIAGDPRREVALAFGIGPSQSAAADPVDLRAG